MGSAPGSTMRIRERSTATHGVAQLYFAQDKLIEAEKLLLFLRDAYRRKPGAVGTETLDVANSLAVVYEAQRKFEQAERLLVDAVKESQRATRRPASEHD